MPDTFCTRCHQFVTDERHEHQPLLAVKFGTDPKPGTQAAIILDAMQQFSGWFTTWDMVPLTHSVHVRDNIGELKDLGWCFDEDWVTENGKRFKKWRLLLPRQNQGGLF